MVMDFEDFRCSQSVNQILERWLFHELEEHGHWDEEIVTSLESKKTLTS